MALAIKNLLHAIITAKTEDNKATCLRWHDKRVVNMLSTFHNNEMVDKKERSKLWHSTRKSYDGPEV